MLMLFPLLCFKPLGRILWYPQPPTRSYTLFFHSLCLWPHTCPQLSCVHAKSLQSCSVLCNPVDCSPPGSSVHGVLQVTGENTRVGVPCPSPWDRPDPGIEPVSPALAGEFFSTGATWGAPTQLCSGYLCWNCVSDHLNLLQTLWGLWLSEFVLDFLLEYPVDNCPHRLNAFGMVVLKPLLNHLFNKLGFMKTDYLHCFI